MATQKQMFTPREASRILGFNYGTIKNWILTGRLKSYKTPGGHHRVSLEGLKSLLAENVQNVDMGFRTRRISERNQLSGKVVSLQVTGLVAEVVLAVENAKVTAIITAEAVREMRLKTGDSATALINSIDVMIGRFDDGGD